MNSMIFDIIFRTTVIYVVVVIGLRLVGKRHVAQLSIIDLVLILLLSNAVQNAMVGENSSLLGGMTAAMTLLVLNYLFSYFFFRFRKVTKVFEGTPTLLIHNGRVIMKHLEQEKITAEELERVIREHGIESIAEVKTAVMEVDGTISIIGGAGEKQIETFKHRRAQLRNKK